MRRSAYGKLDARDRRTFWIAHHAPPLLCAWLTQTWLPTSPIVRGERGAFTDKDWEILTELWRKQRESGQQVDRVRNSHSLASFFLPFFLAILPVLTWWKISKSHFFSQAKATRQGTYESLCRDATILFGRWEFDPTEMRNPFPDGEGVVSIWQGYEDRIVQVEIQRHVARRLPWVRYHERPEAGHALPDMDGVGDEIVRELLLGAGEAPQSEPRAPR